jgi:hypothetical protein
MCPAWSRVSHDFNWDQFLGKDHVFLYLEDYRSGRQIYMQIKHGIVQEIKLVLANIFHYC